MRKFERNAFPYLLLAPTLIIFGLFLFFPALNGLWISLTKWDGVNPQVFVGIRNYIKLFTDRGFWDSFLRTIFFTGVSVPLVYVSAMGLALLLSGARKGNNFFRAVFYWPTMISSIIVGLTWRFLLGEEFGVINYLLTVMGRSPVKWLTDQNYSMAVVIFVTAWSMSGVIIWSCLYPA